MRRSIKWEEIVPPELAMLITEEFMQMAIAKGVRVCHCGTILSFYNSSKKCFRCQTNIISREFLDSKEAKKQDGLLLSEGLPKEMLPKKKNHFVAGKSQQRRLPLKKIA